MPQDKAIIDPTTNKAAKSAVKSAASEARATAHEVADMAAESTETLTNAAGEALRSTQDTARRAFDEALGATKQGLDQAGSRIFQNIDQISAFGKGNVDAVVQSSQVFAKGAEEFTRRLLSFTQQAIELNVNTGRALMGVKSLRDFADLQSQYSRTSFDSLIQESTKLSEMALKTTTEALEPINTRATAVFEQISRPQA